MSSPPGPPILDPKADALAAFKVLMAGGLAIIPVNMGYAIVSTTTTALERAFTTKQRKPHKRHAMIGSWELHKEIHVLPEREAGMVKLLVRDLDMPLGVVAPFKRDHPIVKQLGEETLARSEMEGTLAMLVNGGPVQDELVRLTREAGVPCMGSSANMTGKGTKSRVEDIEGEILAVADLVVNYGHMKYYSPRTSSCMYDFGHMRLLRYGACYEVLRDAMARWYGIELPEDPGREVLASGNLLEEQNRY